jgi:uncharacterized membrane protein
VKYTARDRATAILICQVAALNPVRSPAVVDAAAWLGRQPGTATTLACAAWMAVFLAINDVRLAYAEAERLLRDGWSPGEPVVRLGGRQ